MYEPTMTLLLLIPFATVEVAVGKLIAAYLKLCAGATADKRIESAPRNMEWSNKRLAGFM